MWLHIWFLIREMQNEIFPEYLRRILYHSLKHGVQMLNLVSRSFSGNEWAAKSIRQHTAINRARRRVSPPAPRHWYPWFVQITDGGNCLTETYSERLLEEGVRLTCICFAWLRWDAVACRDGYNVAVNMNDKFGFHGKRFVLYFYIDLKYILNIKFLNFWRFMCCLYGLIQLFSICWANFVEFK
jgi:hypothetical protein